jgi:hypothetical protein
VTARRLLALLVLAGLLAACAPCAEPGDYFCRHAQPADRPERGVNGGM